jgi:hypothetical protein
MEAQSFGCHERMFFPSYWFPRCGRGWLQGGAARRHGIGLIKEDADQMAGIFYLRDRGIVRAFRYKAIEDEPDYLGLIG